MSARLKSRLVPGSGLRKATLAVTHAQHWLAAAKQLQASMAVACFLVSVGCIVLLNKGSIVVTLKCDC